MEVALSPGKETRWIKQSRERVNRRLSPLEQWVFHGEETSLVLPI